MKNIPKIDLHMHSTVSDGTDTPEEILSHVREAGIEWFALTDHDAVKGCARIRSLLEAEDPRFLNGVEFSCRDEEGKYHILGYGYDPEKAAISQVVKKGHSLRMKKVNTRLDGLKKRFGVIFPENEVKNLLALDNPGKPHIGNLMVKYGYAQSKEQAIHEYINMVSARSEYIRPEEAIEGILQSGGIPVLAHPPFGSGEERITGSEMEHRLHRLIGFGLRGLEGFYSAYTPEMCARMLSFAEKYDLYVTAGSDYHGKNKPVLLGNTHLEWEQELPERLERFLEAVFSF